MKYSKYDMTLEMIDIYRLVEKVYDNHTHAFVNGCGRDTMANWFHEQTGIFFKPNMIRMWLIDLCQLGILKRGKSKSGHTTFTATGKK